LARPHRSEAIRVLDEMAFNKGNCALPNSEGDLKRSFSKDVNSSVKLGNPSEIII
jgi:hypothetical protein